jgi:excisionase family DNA binding protein
MEQLYKIEETATILGIDRGTCANWIREGKIPHIRLNGSRKAIRVPASLLEAYIQTTIREQSDTAQLDEYAIHEEITSADEQANSYDFA